MQDCSDFFLYLICFDVGVVVWVVGCALVGVGWMCFWVVSESEQSIAS